MFNNPENNNNDNSQMNEEKIVSEEEIKENPEYYEQILKVLNDYNFDEKMIYCEIKEKDLNIDPTIFNPPIVEQTIQTRLTEKEKKKLRRERRLDYQKEIQEKIKYGLVPPPPPKVKISNFMKIMNSEAAQDPTKVFFCGFDEVRLKKKLKILSLRGKIAIRRET